MKYLLKYVFLVIVSFFSYVFDFTMNQGNK